MRGESLPTIRALVVAGWRVPGAAALVRLREIAERVEVEFVSSDASCPKA